MRGGGREKRGMEEEEEAVRERERASSSSTGLTRRCKGRAREI